MALLRRLLIPIGGFCKILRNAFAHKVKRREKELRLRMVPLLAAILG